MKRFSVVIILLLIVLISFSGASFAKKKKPKLQVPQTPIDFSAEMPDSFDLNVTRSNNSVPVTDVKFISPDNAKVYESDVLVEWKSPTCSDKVPCTIYIKNLQDKIINKEDITHSNYLIDVDKLNLQAGMCYKVSIDQKADTLDQELLVSTESPVELWFYLMSDQEKKSLDEALNDLRSEKGYYKNYSELVYFVDNGIWYDSVAMLSQLLNEYPEDKQLIEYKDNLYSIIKK